MSNPYDPYNNSDNNSDNNPGGQDGGTQGNPPPPPPYGGAGQGSRGGQPPPPYGQNPYPPDAAGQAPYGQGGYGQPPYGQGGYGLTPDATDAPRKTDAVSITGFVMAFTCFLSPIGVILGLVGLGRTKGGQRKGRWAAIAAIPLGLIFSAVLALIIFGVVFVVKNNVTPDNAEPGQCVAVSRDNGEYSLLKQDCTETHDAEVIYVGTASDYEGSLSGTVDPIDVCTSLLPAGDLETLSSYPDELVINLVIADPENISPDDTFLCFAEKTLGSLDAPILD